MPKSSANRKLGDKIKRAKKAKAHALVLAKLKEALKSAGGASGWWLESSRKASMMEIIRNLQKEVYDPLINEHFMSQEDFPDVRRMQKLLVSEDFAKFEDLDKEMIEVLDNWMDQGIATVAKNENKKGPDGSQEVVSGGPFDGVMDSKSSFLTYPNIISGDEEKD